MSNKAPIYKEKNTICDVELLKQLHYAVVELEENMKATIVITKGDCYMGFGVGKTQKGIAADSVISIVRAIKLIKGW